MEYTTNPPPTRASSASSRSASATVVHGVRLRPQSAALAGIKHSIAAELHRVQAIPLLRAADHSVPSEQAMQLRAPRRLDGGLNEAVRNLDDQMRPSASTSDVKPAASAPAAVLRRSSSASAYLPPPPSHSTVHVGVHRHPQYRTAPTQVPAPLLVPVSAPVTPAAAAAAAAAAATARSTAAAAAAAAATTAA